MLVFLCQVDCRSRILCAQERASLQHSADKIFLDETEINQRVAVLLGRTVRCLFS